MRQQCIQAVANALGRPITVAEANKIEQKIRDAMVSLGMRDPQRWQALTPAQRLTEAGQTAAQNLVDAANLKKRRLQQAIAAHDRIENYANDQVAMKADGDKLSSLYRLLWSKPDAKGNVTGVEQDAKGITATTMGRLVETWDSIHPRLFGLLANKEAEGQFIKAAYGETKGIRPEITKAAKKWLEVMEVLRQRYNAAGGDVGKRKNWGLPQEWAQDRLIKIKKQPFINHMMTLIDRTAYRHEDGKTYSAAEMEQYLGEAWLTITTNAANKPLHASHPGGSIKANRHSEHRYLHLKDPKSALIAMKQYGGKSVLELMAGHVTRMSRDIALIEKFGPNADHAIDHFIEKFKAETALAKANDADFNPAAIDKQAAKVATLYNYIAGNHPPPPNRRTANAMAVLRSLLSAAKLGSAAVTSISDEGTLHLTAAVNNLPAFRVFMQELRTLNPLDRAELRMAERAGLMVNTMLDEVNRFGDETLGSHVPHKIASAVIRVSGLNALTEARRRAFAVTMLDTIGDLTRKTAEISKLDASDWKILKSKGIDQETWDIWRQAKTDDWGGSHTVLTPESIFAVQGIDDLAKEKAASKLLAVVMDERDIAVIEPGAAERAMTIGDTVRGTFSGEIARSFMQFKSFPFAMMNRHWKRGMGMYKNAGGKVGYIGVLLAAQTAMGAIALEINDIVSGKDPRSLNPANPYGMRNILAAALKGGGLSLYGDFLFADVSEFGRTMAGSVGGPVLGLGEDAAKLTLGNIHEALKGEETHIGAEAARFARGYTPGASIWYTKAVTDRVIFHQLQELANPGYLKRAQRRARKTYGTEYWWDQGAMPGEIERGPDIGNIAARDD